MGHAGAWINDHPDGAAPFNEPNGEAWIIGNHRASTNDDRINAGANMMQMLKCCSPINIARFTRQCRNPPVKRLPQLSNNKRFRFEMGRYVANNLILAVSTRLAPSVLTKITRILLFLMAKRRDDAYETAVSISNLNSQ